MFEMFAGNHRDKCSVDDFITRMPTRSGSGLCKELHQERENHRLRVFRYPYCTSKSSAYAGSMEQRILCFLLSIEYWYKDSLMIQFWIPEKSSSRVVMLTVSGQPFAIGEPCIKGLCRYRYSCLEQDIEAGDITNTKIGPVGKVFSQGYHEFRAGTKSSFSNYDFANTCGIGNDWSYLALPLFQCYNASDEQAQQCVGVVEILSYNSFHSNFWYLAVLLKDSGIEYRRSDNLECLNARRSVLKSTMDKDILHYLRDELKSPLIQIWLPCMCDTKSRPANEFVCTWASMDVGLRYHLRNEYLFYHYGSCSGKISSQIQNPLVGRVYSENKACFVRDTTQLNISDYPFVRFTLSNDLKACVIFTLKTIHPELHSLVLQVFLPHLQNCDHGNFPALLNSLLSAVAQELSDCNSSFGLQENEEFLVSNSHSDDDNVIFFNIHRSSKSIAVVAAVGHGREDHCQNREINEAIDDREKYNISEDLQIIEVMREFRNFNQEKQQLPPTLEVNDDTAQTSREASVNAEVVIDLDDTPSGEEVEAAAETLDGNLVKSHKMLGSSIQYMAGTSKEPCTIDDDEITLDIINQYRGRAKLADVARELKVSRATLKRRCRKLGIKRWPYCKRNEVHNIESSAGLPNINLNEVGYRVNHESEIRQCSNHATAKGKSNIAAGNHEIERGFPLIVKAICRGDIAKFPFHSNSGIEELRRELEKRLELDVGRFKIKYKDEDEDGDTEWINLFCNEDLIFCIETLKASEKSTLILSLFPSAV